jgi:hypothetical protein
MFEILVCAMAPALEQNTTLAVRRVSFMPCPSEASAFHNARPCARDRRRAQRDD